MRNEGGPSPLVLVADHAGAEIPRALAGLGLSASALETHIAVDIGVAALARALSDLLAAELVEQRWSRLVIDCNRDPGRPDSSPVVSDGIPIPGNGALTAEARQARRAAVFDPYHARIEAALERRIGRPGPRPILVSLHSFTPVLGGSARPWRLGVLHAGDSPFSAAALGALREAFGAAAVGDNAPYRMDETDYTVPRHARGRGLDYLELETRQDLIADSAAAAALAAILADVLATAAKSLSGGPDS